MKNLIRSLNLSLLLFSFVALAQQNPNLPEVIGSNNPVVIINPGMMDGGLGGGYTGGYGSGSIYPMGGYGGLGSYPGAGQGLGMGMGLGGGGIPGAVTNMDNTSCPFLQKDADVSALWNSTKDTLKQISDKKESGACTLVQSNGATLQRAMENFEKQKFRAIGGSSTAYAAFGSNLSGEILPNCDNYEDLYQNEYEQMLNLVTRNYPMAAMPGDYLNACKNFYPLATDPNFTYSQNFTNCLGDSLAKKIEVAHLECQGKSKYLDKIENQKASFKAQQEALLQVNNAISQLTKNIGQCDNKDLVNSSIKSVISVGSMIASPAIGGIGGVAAAFGGDILNNIVNLLYNSKVKKDWAEMDKEDRYNMNACLFYQSQKLRCSEFKQQSQMQLPSPVCDIENLNPAGKETIQLVTAISQISSFSSADRKMTELVNFLSTKKNEKSPIEFLSTDVLNGLKEKSLYGEMANLEKYIQGYEEIKKIRDGIKNNSIKASQTIPNVSLNQSGPGAAPLPAYKVLESLEKEMLELDIQSTLSKFIFSESKKDPSAIALYNDYVKQITTQYQEMQKKALFDWNNLRTVDMATTALVNNLKDQFEDRLKVHFSTDIKTAMAFEKDSPGKAFDSMSGIINDCLYTEGMYAMEKSDLRSEARSTAKISENATFKKYCGKINCDIGLNPFVDKYSSPEKFRTHQCMSNMNSSYTVTMMKSMFLQTGKICGQSLSEIYKSGN